MQTLGALARELMECRAGSERRISGERRHLIEQTIARLRHDRIGSAAPSAGEPAPSGVTLQDGRGRPVLLDDEWRRGPLVLVFFRGGWCPYCSIGLQAWQRHHDELRHRGARLVAVSPESDAFRDVTMAANDLSLPLLRDADLAGAERFGLVFDLPAELVRLYERCGTRVPLVNDNGRWAVPVPATFVIDRDGVVVYAHVDADFRVRAEPADVLRAVEQAQDHGLV